MSKMTQISYLSFTCINHFITIICTPQNIYNSYYINAIIYIAKDQRLIQFWWLYHHNKCINVIIIYINFYFNIFQERLGYEFFREDRGWRIGTEGVGDGGVSIVPTRKLDHVSINWVFKAKSIFASFLCSSKCVIDIYIYIVKSKFIRV